MLSPTHFKPLCFMKTFPLSSKAILIAGSILSVLVIALIIWSVTGTAKGSKQQAASKAPANSVKSTAIQSEAGNQTAETQIALDNTKPGAPSTGPLTQQAISEVIASTLAELASGDPARIKAALDKLDETLSHQDSARAAISAIMGFLRSGKNAPTGEEFQLGESGVLTSGTTLREVLLDHLGTLCRDNGSTEAVDMARTVLAGFGSANEWAISLRNCAWLAPEDRALLNDKVAEMLDHKPWMENPSRGLLEAFDVAAFAGSTQVIQQLNANLSLGENSPIWRASTVALEQMAANHPMDVLQWLAANPDAMSDHPLQRADLLSKANLADPAQRRIIEDYLGRTNLSVDERSKIIAGLATPGGFLSNNLLTKPGQVTEESENQRLAMLNQIGREWQNKGRFSDLAGEINNFVLTTTLPPK